MKKKNKNIDKEFVKYRAMFRTQLEIIKDVYTTKNNTRCSTKNKIPV